MIKLICAILLINATIAFGQRVEIGEKIKTELRLIDYTINEDTLNLISSSDFLYYPFGVFKSADELKLEFPKLFHSENGDLYLSHKNNYVKFFFDVDKHKLEIVYAKISIDKFHLANGIVTGMTKQEVFNRLFNSVPVNLDNIKVLKLESALIGICHYYTFENNILTTVCFDTDYQMNKN